MENGQSHNGYVFAYHFDLADRMRKALRVAGMSVQDAAEALNVSRNTVGNWISDRTKPSQEQLVVWAAVTGAPHEWLLTGKLPDCGNPT